jgi:hypothetical protein
MTVVEVPQEVQDKVATIRRRREEEEPDLASGIAAWGLALKVDDSEGNLIRDELLVFNGPDENMTSFWLVVDLTAPGDADVDLLRLDELVAALAWVEQLPGYDVGDPEQHKNYKILRAVQQLVTDCPDADVSLNLYAASREDLSQVSESFAAFVVQVTNLYSQGAFND